MIYTKNLIEHCKKNDKKTRRNSNTTLEAHSDNNLAVIATACCEQQVLTQELEYRFPWLSILTLPPYYR